MLLCEWTRMALAERPLEVKEKKFFKNLSQCPLNLDKGKKTQIINRLQQKDCWNSQQNRQPNEYWRRYIAQILNWAVRPPHCNHTDPNIFCLLLVAGKKLSRWLWLRKPPTAWILNQIWVQHVRVESFKKPVQRVNEINQSWRKKSQTSRVQGSGFNLKKGKRSQRKASQTKSRKLHSIWTQWI